MLRMDVQYSTVAGLRITNRGADACQLRWFDGHVWAYAEHYGLERIVIEDFQHGRIYGTARAHDLLR